jgi:RNA polymerase sigma factor (sigma-70 family)
MSREHDQVLQEYVATRFAGLRRSAYLMCGDWQFAEELVRATLAKLVVSWRHGDIHDLDAHAHRAVMKAFRRDWRRGLRRRERVFSAIADPVSDQAPPEKDPVVKISVLAALHQLPPKRRAVVIMHRWEDLSVQQTADALGISPRAVKAHDTRGLTFLRAALGDLLPDPDGEPADGDAVSVGGAR